MKSILISIQPQWVEKILNGKKTIEIRKTIPKCELPCKVYIYCTKRKLLSGKNVFINNKEKRKTLGVADHWGSNMETLLINENTAYEYETYKASGKVVAEFTLKEYEHFEIYSDKWKISKEIADHNKQISKESCLSQADLLNYLGRRYGYALRINDLIVYDKPKELSKFNKICENEEDCWSCKKYNMSTMECCNKMVRPPQSWCYVEEL